MQHADKLIQEATKEILKGAINNINREGHFVSMENIVDYSVSKSVDLFVKKSNLKYFMFGRFQ